MIKESFEEGEDLDVDSYTASDSTESFFSDDNIKNAINEFRVLAELSKNQISQTKRYLSQRNLLGAIIFLRMELQLNDELLDKLLAYFGKTIKDFETELSQEVRIDVMVEYLIRELGATEYDAGLIKALWHTKDSELDGLSLESRREFIRVFNELGSLIRFPAILYKELMDKVFHIQDSIKPGNLTIKSPPRIEEYPTQSSTPFTPEFGSVEEYERGVGDRPYILSNGRVIHLDDEDDWEG